MSPQDLKNSILQLAMQGRLVEQRPEEGRAEELYCQIQEEKKRLVKEGKIKKGKPLPEITEEEEPFEIPETWKWVRLGEIIPIKMGQSPKGTTVSETIEGIEFHQGKIFFGNKYIKHSPQKSPLAHVLAEPNSVLLSVRAPVGKVNITDREIGVGRGLACLSCPPGIDVDFIFYLLSSYEKIFSKQATGTTFSEINRKVIENQPIPLLPLEEQKRIVKKLDELMPLCDRYEKTHDHLQTLDSRFPSDIRKSILQEAMQGRLVEQRPEEGSAEELYCQIQEEKKRLVKEGKIKKGKPLPEITEEEEPFEIPETWKWVRLGEIVHLLGGEKMQGRLYPYFDASYLRGKTQAISKTSGEFIHKKDQIILVDGENSGEVFVAPCDGYMGSTFKRLFFSALMFTPFTLYFLASKREYWRNNKKGVAVPHLNKDLFSNTLVPLPPLEEQKRIVNKLEEIMPLISSLKETHRW